MVCEITLFVQRINTAHSKVSISTVCSIRLLWTRTVFALLDASTNPDIGQGMQLATTGLGLHQSFRHSTSVGGSYGHARAVSSVSVTSAPQKLFTPPTLSSPSSTSSAALSRIWRMSAAPTVSLQRAYLQVSGSLSEASQTPRRSHPNRMSKRVARYPRRGPYRS